MDIFKGQNHLEFAERFKTDSNCKEYLGKIKWKDGYSCRKCENHSYQVRKNFSRTCNRCSDTESPTANTIFHRVRFGVRTVFSFVLKWQRPQKVYQQLKWVFVMASPKRPHDYLCLKLEKQ